MTVQMTQLAASWLQVGWNGSITCTLYNWQFCLDMAALEIVHLSSMLHKPLLAKVDFGWTAVGSLLVATPWWGNVIKCAQGSG